MLRTICEKKTQKLNVVTCQIAIILLVCEVQASSHHKNCSPLISFRQIHRQKTYSCFFWPYYTVQLKYKHQILFFSFNNFRHHLPLINLTTHTQPTRNIQPPRKLEVTDTKIYNCFPE